MADQDDKAKRDAEARDAAKRKEMTGWIKRTFADPEFRALNSMQKIQVMEGADPEFASIPSPADKARVVQSYMYQVPTGNMPSSGSAWRDVAEGFTASGLQPFFVGKNPAMQALEMRYGIKLKSPSERPEIQYWLRPPESKAGKAGALLEPAVETLFAPELKATKVPRLLKGGAPLLRRGLPVMRETLGSFAKRSAFEGAKMGTQAYLHGDDPEAGAILGASVPALGMMVRGMVARPLSGMAQFLYNRALYPTTKITKGEAKEVVPELLQRRFWAATFPRLKDQAEEHLQNAEHALTDAENAAIKRSQQTYTTTGYRNVRPGPPPPRGPGPTINVTPPGGTVTMPGQAVTTVPGAGVGPVGPGGMLDPEAAARASRFESASQRVRQFFAGRAGAPPGAGAAAGPGAAAAAGRQGYRVYTTAPGLIDVKPVFDTLRAEMAKTNVRGVFPTPQARQLYFQLLDQTRRLGRIARVGYTPNGVYGWFMTLPEAIATRRILDKPLGQAGVFYEDPKWASLFHVQELAANRLRGVINDTFPELAAANHEYHLWKTSVGIMEQTEKRKIGQVGLLHTLATLAPFLGRGLTGADVTNEIAQVALANAAMSFATSAGTQTLGGVGMQAVADALTSRNLESFLQAAGTALRPRAEGQEDYGMPPPPPERPARAAPQAGVGGTPTTPEPQGGRGAPAAEPRPSPVGAPLAMAGSQEGQEAAPSPSRAAAVTARAAAPTPPAGTTWEYWGLKPPPGTTEAPAVRPGSRAEISRQIAETGRQIGGARMPQLPRIMQLVAAQESSARQTDPRTGRTLTSPKKAMGVMQLTQETAERYGVDPHNAADNIRGGAMYLRDLMAKYGSDAKNLPKVFAAYYGGEKPVDKYNGVPPRSKYPLTVQYAEDMMARMGYRWRLTLSVKR